MLLLLLLLLVMPSWRGTGQVAALGAGGAHCCSVLGRKLVKRGRVGDGGGLGVSSRRKGEKGGRRQKAHSPVR
ncbi:hypothetical protein BDP81DRAFT_430901 [Colletotrichum phormii]|uniref:Secreted protein n=1 Tax=Colletotrichum phormii TaxID=359342 RepID=A0AAI9ZNB0_9PEZI|nr:uncharacterized protein BDP81DRAFT_430901 [Colletotrichum phormii]KAK1635146.1 hypothetical protein BDP81DRAFT_430901 [Colletotrichum phormii]